MDKTIVSDLGLLDLPCETLIQIFEYLSFEEVAKSRIICKRIDDICQKILNRGFKRAAHQSALAYKRIKSLLPRRESERRNHSLVRHADILSSVETRLSMLSMTYTKYIDLNMCCFIPGRVLDEIFHILRLTKQRCVPLRPLEILQEFRDISSMAIEHFDEHIASEFKRALERNALCKVVVHTGGGGGGGGSSPDSIHTAESVCGPSELLWVRKYARTSYVTPLTTIRLPDGSKLPNDEVAASTVVSGGCGGNNKTASAQRLVCGKEIVIKRLEKTIAGLEKKLIKQNKHYKLELYRLNRNFSMTKRRLDEMDSKYKELIETVRQYNLAPPSSSTSSSSSQQTQNGQTSSNTQLNATTTNTEIAAAATTTKMEDATVGNQQEIKTEPIDIDNANNVDVNVVPTMSQASSDTAAAVFKRSWLMAAAEAESETDLPEISIKKLRSDCAQ